MSKSIKGPGSQPGHAVSRTTGRLRPRGDPARVINVFIHELVITGLDFKSEPAARGLPGHHPKTMLKLCVYGYLTLVPSSRRLEEEAQHNSELVWLTGRLASVFKIIVDFKRDKPVAIHLVCRDS